MLRELVLVSADITTAKSPLRHAPPVPDGASIETIRAPNNGSLFGTGPVSIDEAKLRLSEGDVCIAVTDSLGLVAQMWCSEKARFIEWIGCDIRPPEGHVHLFNAWVRPDSRGQSLQWVLAAEACSNVLAEGQNRILAGLERKEYAPFSRKYAAMGLGLMEPVKSIWAARILGFTLTLSTRPPSCLESARRRAKSVLARYSEQ